MLDTRIGFSTGALEKGNYRKALHWLQQQNVRSVELSALRYEELDPLIEHLDELRLDTFSYVSFHAPSYFAREREEHVVAQLTKVASRGWNIVAHPDVIYSPRLWEEFGSQLLIENMDRRKALGRTVSEMETALSLLPRARICLDVAHARQMDTTLTLLWSLVKAFGSRIGEVHISELDSRCRHHAMSWQSVSDYRRFAAVLQRLPVIIESVLHTQDWSLRNEELRLANQAMT
jgi:hypothetical protein